MKILNITCLACAAALIAGCGGSNDITTGVPFIIGPGATPAEADAAVNATFNDAEDIAFTEGTTAFATLPTTGASYTGVIYGDQIGGGGPATTHAADLKLNANFSGDTVDGELSNFVTDVANFQNPTGTVPVSGTIFNDTGDAAIAFSGSALLTGSGGVTATWDIFDADGFFSGDDADVIIGTQRTNVFWETGPNAATTSFSDGEFAAIRD